MVKMCALTNTSYTQTETFARIAVISTIFFVVFGANFSNRKIGPV
jgi:hypothetical protein